ncbi:MAG: hypothetical protein GY950_17725, partial [bacterium]|nr:hypothetical protein [bacterium]
MSRISRIESPPFELGKGKTYFVLCDNAQYRDELFSFYERRGLTAGIDRINAKEIDIGLDAAETIAYFGRIKGGDTESIMGNLSVLGVGAADIDKIKRKPLSPELLKKIYVAVTLSVKADTIVIKDFIRDENKKFEEQFRRLLYILEKRDKTVLYLGSEMFETRLKTLYQEAEANNAIVIDLMSISLR